jgi:hypothetical protein
MVSVVVQNRPLVLDKSEIVDNPRVGSAIELVAEGSLGDDELVLFSSQWLPRSLLLRSSQNCPLS